MTRDRRWRARPRRRRRVPDRTRRQNGEPDERQPRVRARKPRQRHRPRDRNTRPEDTPISLNLFVSGGGSTRTSTNRYYQRVQKQTVGPSSWWSA